MGKYGKNIDGRKATMKMFYEAMQESGNVKKALKDDANFRKWYYAKRKRKR